MILDRQNTVSINQAITATAFSTDTVDLTLARDIGAGGGVAMDIFCRVTTTFTTGTAATLSVEFVTSPNASLASPVVVVATPALAVASLTAGQELLRITIPVTQVLGLNRYIGLRYTVANTFTAGTVTAGFIFDRQADAYYISGVPVGGF